MKWLRLFLYRQTLFQHWLSLGLAKPLIGTFPMLAFDSTGETCHKASFVQGGSEAGRLRQHWYTVMLYMRAPPNTPKEWRNRCGELCEKCFPWPLKRNRARLDRSCLDLDRPHMRSKYLLQVSKSNIWLLQSTFLILMIKGVTLTMYSDFTIPPTTPQWST